MSFTVTATVTDSQSGATASASATATTATGSAIFAAYPGGGNTLPTAGYEAANMANRKLSAFSCYEAITQTGFPNSALITCVEQGRDLAVCLASRNGSTGIPWTVVASGAYDADLATIGKKLGALPGKVYVGLDNEFDGGSRQVQSGALANYPAAFVHVMNVLKPLMPNLVRCWVPTGNNMSTAVANAYPGDSDVDMIMWDPYDVKLTKGGPLGTFEAFANWLRSQSFGKGKPWGLFETGTNCSFPGAAAWIEGIPAAAQEVGLSYVQWFNSTGNLGSTVIPPGSACASALATWGASAYFL